MGEADDDEEASKTLSEDSEAEKAAKDNAILLYQTCLIQSGFSLPTDSAKDFSGRLERLVRTGLGVEASAAIEEPEVEIPEDPEPEVDDADDAEDIDLDDIPEDATKIELEADDVHDEL